MSSGRPTGEHQEPPAPITTLLLLVAFLVTLAIAWWIGIRATPRPAEGHSLGFVASHEGASKGRGPGASPRLVRFNRTAGLRLDMTVSVDPGLFSCGDATVDVVVTGTRAFWDEHPFLRQGRTRFAFGWDRQTEPEPVDSEFVSDEEPILVSASPDRQAGLRAISFGTPYLEENRLRAGYYRDPDPETGGKRAVSGTIADWGNRERRWPVHLRFEADWVEPRSFGSCWVMLPSLPANGTIPGHLNALWGVDAREEVGRSNPPTDGRTTLVTEGEVALDKSTPAADEFQTVLPATGSEELASGASAAVGAPVWRCRPPHDLSYVQGKGIEAIPPDDSFSADTCAAVAVAETPWAAENSTLIALLLGLLLGALATPLFRDIWALISYWYGQRKGSA